MPTESETQTKLKNPVNALMKYSLRPRTSPPIRSAEKKIWKMLQIFSSEPRIEMRNSRNLNIKWRKNLSFDCRLLAYHSHLWRTHAITSNSANNLLKELLGISHLTCWNAPNERSETRFRHQFNLFAMLPSTSVIRKLF